MQKRLALLKRNQALCSSTRCIEGISEINKIPPIVGSGMQNINLSFDNRLLGPLLKKDFIGNGFLGILFSHPDTERSLKPWTSRDW